MNSLALEAPTLISATSASKFSAIGTCFWIFLEWQSINHSNGSLCIFETGQETPTSFLRKSSRPKLIKTIFPNVQSPSDYAGLRKSFEKARPAVDCQLKSSTSEKKEQTWASITSSLHLCDKNNSPVTLNGCLPFGLQIHPYRGHMANEKTARATCLDDRFTSNLNWWLWFFDDRSSILWSLGFNLALPWKGHWQVLLSRTLQSCALPLHRFSAFFPSSLTSLAKRLKQTSLVLPCISWHFIATKFGTLSSRLLSFMHICCVWVPKNQTILLIPAPLSNDPQDYYE